MAFRADWIPTSPNLGDTLLKGGTIRLSGFARQRNGQVRLRRDYRQQDPLGNGSDGRAARGMRPNPWRFTTDAHRPRQPVHDTTGRRSIMTMRMCGGVIVMDRDNWEPVCFLYARSSESNIPVKKISSNPDTWDIKLEEVGNPVHEAGFNPAGTDFVIMNNLRANNVAVFDVSDPDPRKWHAKPT